MKLEARKIRAGWLGLVSLALAVPVVPAHAGAAAGGLTAFPAPVIGENLLANPGIEQGKSNWLDNGFTLDTSTAHNGQGSLRITDANLIPSSQVAFQTLHLKKGHYRIAGWVKLQGMAATKGNGVRLCLYAPVAWPPSIASGCTDPVKGTADWQAIQFIGITVTQETDAKLLVDAYGDPDGSAWFDDLELRQEQQPLEVFLLYPNYRGMLFDDQSQTVRARVFVAPPDGSAAAGFRVTGQVVEESSGAILKQESFAGAASFTAAFDLASLPLGGSVLMQFQMSKGNGGQSFRYPAYRIIKVPGGQRASMSVSYDEQNRILLRGKPAFLLGVYDAGIGYTGSEAAWESQFMEDRRLFELPINFYLNYWFGSAPNSSMLPMMDDLQAHGIFNLTNANCFSSSSLQQIGSTWFLKGTDADIQQRAESRGFAGFYAADECAPSLVSDVFAHYQRMKTLDPDGVVLGTLAKPDDIPLWRDALDLVSNDSYPLAGAEPPQGYPLAQVALDSLATRDAVLGARPFVMTIQFYQNTSLSRWPNTEELRSMSYAAIVGGANGLFYWSLGSNALAYVCSGWCAEKVEYFNRLKTVLTELRDLAPVLSGTDHPELLGVNSNSGAIRTRVKVDGGRAYLIAFNMSAARQQARFTWARQPVQVRNQRNRLAVQIKGSDFEDEFKPYEARVYQIEQRGETKSR